MAWFGSEKTHGEILVEKVDRLESLRLQLNDGPARRAELKAELKEKVIQYEQLLEEVSELQTKLKIN